MGNPWILINFILTATIWDTTQVHISDRITFLILLNVYRTIPENNQKFKQIYVF